MNINFSQKESRVVFFEKFKNTSPSFLAPNILVILFLVAILERKLIVARAILDEIQLRPRVLINNIGTQINLKSLLPKLWTLFDSDGFKSTLAYAPLLCEFLNIATTNFSELLYSGTSSDSLNTFNTDDKIVKFDYSLSKNNRHVNLFIRKNWWENVTSTREHEAGPRMKNTFESGGWTCDLLQPNFDAALIFKNKISDDIAIIDMQAIIFTKNLAEAQKFLELLKKSHKKIIGIFYDCWRNDALSNALEYSEFFDFYWIQSVELLNKFKTTGAEIICFPFPAGVRDDDLEIIKASKSLNNFNFSGGIEDTNYTRLYWLLSLSGDRRFNFDISSHKAVNIDAYLDYILYLTRLSNYSYGVNFSTRSDDSKIVTGRSLELITIQRLLVQEKCPDLHYYFQSGLHFLEFDSIESLDYIFEKVSKDPNIARRISTEGHAFWKDKYCDAKLVSHFEFQLFN